MAKEVINHKGLTIVVEQKVLTLLNPSLKKGKEKG